MKLLHFLSFFLFCHMAPASVFSEQTGTLIVTYETDFEANRLDRVRFWMKNEENKKSLFPKGKFYVDDLMCQTRMVVIENIVPGKYTLEFLVPNTDNYFEKTPSRQVTITAGDIIKISQQIKPRTHFATVEIIEEATPSLPSEEEKDLLEKLEVAELEVIIQKNEEQEKKIEQEETTEILPETLIQNDFGKLIVIFNPRLDSRLSQNIKVQLKDEEGRLLSTHPQPEQDVEITLESGRMLMIPRLPVGGFLLEIYLLDDEKNEKKFSSQKVRINADKTTTVFPLT